MLREHPACPLPVSVSFQGFAMLSISISQPVVWSPAPAPAVAAVSSAAAVTPVQATARDAQAGAGQSGRDPAAQGQPARAAVNPQERAADRDKAARKGLEAAPLLPRPQSDGRQGQQEAEAEKLEEQKQQTEEAERKLLLQDVIGSAWKASAAVVDVVLGRETPATEATAATEPAAGLVDARAVQPVNDTDPAAEGKSAFELSEDREVVAYDAQGHSSLAPLEAGSLVSHHV